MTTTPCVLGDKKGPQSKKGNICINNFFYLLVTLVVGGCFINGAYSVQFSLLAKFRGCFRQVQQVKLYKKKREDRPGVSIDLH